MANDKKEPLSYSSVQSLSNFIARFARGRSESNVTGWLTVCVFFPVRDVERERVASYLWGSPESGRIARARWLNIRSHKRDSRADINFQLFSLLVSLRPYILYGISLALCGRNLWCEIWVAALRNIQRHWKKAPWSVCLCVRVSNACVQPFTKLVIAWLSKSRAARSTSMPCNN